jgi:hypothetical protein
MPTPAPADSSAHRFSDAAAAGAVLIIAIHKSDTWTRIQHKEIAMTTASGHTSAIRAKKVIGTTVKNSAGEKIGQVEDIVLDKTSNKIIFAVVGFGGFLGMNEKFHPCRGRHSTT